jgi:hypothetical protein
MLNDIVVVGTSIASGVGMGRLRKPEAGAVKSWIYWLAELSNARNVWNHSLPGKPLGLVNADAVEFVKQYYEKYRTYENLFVVLEYSLPSYRHWDPVASARNDCVQMNIVPVTYFKPFESVEAASNSLYYHGNNQLEQQFYVRKPVDLLNQSMHPHEIYHEVPEEEIVPDDLKRFQEQALDWYRPSEENRLRYLKYAFDEIQSAQRYCENINLPYMQTWVGGVTDQYKRAVDRYMKPLLANKRLVPMQEFTAATATLDWSIKPWRNHPDATGHQRIGEFYHNWIQDHKLYQRPHNHMYRGYGS